MTNYKLLTGPFEGSIIEEGTQILDLPFRALDKDLQQRIRFWAEQNPLYVAIDGGANFALKDGSPILMDDVTDAYESSWDSEETDEPINLNPVSEW
jgi:hypothetical protein